MIHDELLDRLDNWWLESDYDYKLINTLRAVVELHKPFMYDGRMGQYERCSFCTTEEEWLGEIYPCHTIQTIEKELK